MGRAVYLQHAVYLTDLHINLKNDSPAISTRRQARDLVFKEAGRAHGGDKGACWKIAGQAEEMLPEVNPDGSWGANISRIPAKP
eukprot:763733-Hanusia_phi.AAC.3